MDLFSVQTKISFLRMGCWGSESGFASSKLTKELLSCEAAGAIAQEFGQTEAGALIAQSSVSESGPCGAHTLGRWGSVHLSWVSLTSAVRSEWGCTLVPEQVHLDEGSFFQFAERNSLVLNQKLCNGYNTHERYFRANYICFKTLLVMTWDFEWCLQICGSLIIIRRKNYKYEIDYIFIHTININI